MPSRAPRIWGCIEDGRKRPQKGWIKLVRILRFRWIKLVRNSPPDWIKLVRISPRKVDQAGENPWIMLVGNDRRVTMISDVTVGQTVVSSDEPAANHIPGHATYFWVLPHHRKYACVQFSTVRNGRAEFDYYVKSFLSKYARFAVDDDGRPAPSTETENEVIITGYRDPDGPITVDGNRLTPRWKTARTRSDGPIERIRRNRHRIRRMIRKNHLFVTTPATRAALRSTFRFLLGVKRHEPQEVESETYRTRLEVDFTPTGVELEEIIDDWRKDEGESSDWNDVGFVLEKESNHIHWLSHASPKKSLELDIDPFVPELIDGRALLRALAGQRGTALASLSTEE
jgi:hypothetical protein